MSTTSIYNPVVDADDGRWAYDGGKLFGPDKIFVSVGGTAGNDRFSSFFRFPAVTFPTIYYINTVTVSFKADKTWSLPVATKLYFNAVANATVPDGYDHAEELSLTTGIGWSISTWTTGTIYTSPDLSTIFAEVITAGFVSGNAVMLIWGYDTGGFISTPDIAEGGNTYATLTINYTGWYAPATFTPQITMIR